jgi:hypothetical protein
MAKKNWSIATSPRNPYKVSDDLSLLLEFEGRIWNRETQLRYADRLASSDLFEGTVSPNNADFSARDRINRSPKTFGFVEFDEQNTIHITEAGRQLIDKRDLDELFTKQLLKWQYPSPKYDSEEYGQFKIKPFYECLKLIKELEGLSKMEMAIFLFNYINNNNYRSLVNEIHTYREERSSYQNVVERKAFDINYFRQRLRRLYAEEISSGDIHVRERNGNPSSVEDFIDTKLRNNRDYADAAMRYFTATGLVTISSADFRLRILDIKQSAVEYILTTINRDPEPFDNLEVFKANLANPTAPLLLDDNQEKLIENIEELSVVSNIEVEEGLNSLSITQLKEKKIELTNTIKNERVGSQIEKLKNYENYEEVMEVFDKIKDQRDVGIPDKSLYLEWNTWRALNILDDGDIKTNMGLDLDGMPINYAPGKKPDIVCYYNNFVLVVEVTMARGLRQYEMEGEPIARHLGDIRRELTTNGDSRPVYGILVAPNINEALLAHLFMIRRTNIRYYGGSVLFIPINIDSLQSMLEVAKNLNGVNSRNILEFVYWVDSSANSSENETEWFNGIVGRMPLWVEGN